MKRTASLRALVAAAAVVCALAVPATAGAAEGAAGEGGPGPAADSVVVAAGPGLVTVPVPEVVARTADGATSYLVPETPGVRWLVDGKPVADVATREDGGWRLGGGPDTAPDVVVAVAEAGHRLLLEDGTTAARAAALDLRVGVEAVRPRTLDRDGASDEYVVPDVRGLVVADAAGTVLEPGSAHDVTGYVDHEAVVVLRLTAAPGHRLEVDGVPVEALPGEGAPWLVELRFADTVAVRSVAPTFTYGDGAGGGVEVPDVEGLEYRVGETVAEPGLHPATGSVTVTARALDGYVLVGDAAWSHTFAGPAPGAGEPAATSDAGPAAAGGARRTAGAGARTPAATGVDAAPAEPAAPQDEAGRAALDPLTLLVGGLVLGGILLVRGRRDQVV
jgi:hypothetical protein